MKIKGGFKAVDYQDFLTTKTSNPRESSFKSDTNYIKEALDNARMHSEEMKREYDAKISEKIKNGDKLSSGEMEYIRRTNPTLYQHIKRIQFKRDMLDKKLKNCKSKKEVKEVSSEAMISIDKKDPDRGPIIAAYNNVIKEFKKSSAYSKLPMETEEEQDRKNTLKKKKDESFGEDLDLKRKRSKFDVNA